MTSLVRLWSYLWLDERAWAEPGLELKNEDTSD